MGMAHGLMHARQAGLVLLVGWPGETALQRAVAGDLFRTMVQRRGAAARLASVDSWRQLAGVATSPPSMTSCLLSMLPPS